jgi:hypothetical protein
MKVQNGREFHTYISSNRVSVVFEVLTAVTRNATVFWNVTPSSLVQFADLSGQRAASINRVHDLYILRWRLRHYCLPKSRRIPTVLQRITTQISVFLKTTVYWVDCFCNPKRKFLL